jgi:hypothetical protein
MKGSAGFQPAVAGILAGNILHNGPLALGVNGGQMRPIAWPRCRGS